MPFLLLIAALQIVAPLPQSAPPEQPAGTTSAVDSDEARFNRCIDRAVDDPAAGIVEANRWRIDGGRYFATQCLGFAYAEQQQWRAARESFVTAAREAETARDRRAAKLWTQAGNAALAGGDPGMALQHFDAALIQDSLAGLNKGELHLDRARALVALGRDGDARAEFAYVHRLAPGDPLGWLLSATLSRRMGDLSRARADITRAVRLAPSDPAVSLELGNIAAADGDTERAREQWRNAITLDRDSAAASAALGHLQTLGEPATPAADPIP